MKRRLLITILGLGLIHNVFNFFRSFDPDIGRFFPTKQKRPPVSSQKQPPVSKNAALPEGFAGFKWGSKPGDFAQLTLLVNKDGLATYEMKNPQRRYPAELTAGIPPKNTRLFFRNGGLAYAIMELDAETADVNKDFLTEKFGKAKTSQQEKTQVHSWQSGNTIINFVVYDKKRAFLQLIDSNLKK